MTAPRGGERRGQHRGVGDRWMAGERISGVTFAQHDSVQITDGPHVGRAGRVLLLAAPPPAAAYLVALDGIDAPVRVAQAALRPAS